VTRRAAITYDGLPIANGGAHTLRIRGCVASLKALQSFVDALSLDPVPTRVAVEVLQGAGVPETFVSAACDECAVRGAERTSRRIGDYSAHLWTIDQGSLAAAAEALERLRPIPTTRLAGHAARLHVTWNLVLCDGSRRPFPYQNEDDYLGFDCGGQHRLGHSFVYACISETTTAHLFLSLPFEEVSEEARRLANEIQAHFPARLSPSHWKIWRLTATGHTYVGRRVPGLVQRTNP
jgi:hypothetical protein